MAKWKMDTSGPHWWTSLFQAEVGKYDKILEDGYLCTSLFQVEGGKYDKILEDVYLCTSLVYLIVSGWGQDVW